MITIYQIGQAGVWTGETAEIEETDGAPPGWTRTQPPALGEGQYAVWSGQWVVVEDLPSPTTETDGPSPVAKPPQMVGCALRIIVDGGEVQAVGGAFRVAAIMGMGEGTFLAVFSESIGQDEPFLVPNNGISSSIIEWGEEYAVIETRDAAGELITPAQFGFSLYNF